MLNRKVLLPFLKSFGVQKVNKRYIDVSCEPLINRKGLVLGAYESCDGGELKLSAAGSKFDLENGNRIPELLRGMKLAVGETRVFNNIGKDFYAVAVTGVGPEADGFNESEVLDECKENVRVAAGAGAQALQDMGVRKIYLEGFTNTEAAAEGASLAVWRYQELRNSETRRLEPQVLLYESGGDPDLWHSGYTKGEAQNIARLLENAPANVMNPPSFAQAAIDILCPCGVNVEIRNRDWLLEKNMTALLAVSRASCDPPQLLELSYCGGGETDKPVVLTGKGVTFDSGGLSLRRCSGMSEYRADIAGAAVVVAVMKALATLAIPINVNGLVPLMENMPGTMSLRPGDVIVSQTGKTIRVENPAYEGRVILADVLSYAANLNPCLNINIATLTEAVRSALGSSATPCFSTSEVVWKELQKAGAETGDRVWRFPAWKYFSERINAYGTVDVDNVGDGRGGDPCKGAAFLLEFAPPVDFLHMDITGTGMRSSGKPLYLRKGFMSGRPTRTIAQFLGQMACPLDKPLPC